MTTEVWGNALEFLKKTPLVGIEILQFQGVWNAVMSIVQGEVQVIGTEDFKKMLESVEVVDKHGGIEQATKILKTHYKPGHGKKKVVSKP